MLNLKSRIGLNVTLTDANLLTFGNEVSYEKFSTRRKSDLASVVADQSLPLNDDQAYFMYRNVRLAADENDLKRKSLRFDLTVIPPGMLGKEYIKTLGHYHPKKPGTSYFYPELYYVVSGQATYILQKKMDENRVEDVIMARVKAGNPIIMPPGYGHVTVNELKEPLVMANWVEASFESDYSDYEKLQGAAYYLIDTFGTAKTVANEKYYNTPRIKEMKSMPELFKDILALPIYQYRQNELLDSMVDLTKYDQMMQVDQVLSF